MAQRWENGSPERRIEAFIGAWGAKTGAIVDTDHLLELASRLFEIENTGISEKMAEQIDGLGKKGRKALAQKNLKSVMGDEGRFGADWAKDKDGATRFSEQSLQKMMDDSKPQMIDGAPFECQGELDIDPAKLLRKVVSAVISAGRGDILWEFPDVLAFFGSRIPQRHEVEHLHNVDQGMCEAADKWPNRIKGYLHH